ncbi:hypothetical protein [Amycolatopsis anabasis]|uniref:hypothetical protein n=1 Tax=Amycolatopsis anabasis TaxID=1840409 RepID=UPI00131DCD79|nr:hypothetical protein [Amycolatopsis anabasis]
MSELTISSAEVTSEQLVEALRAGLDPRYEVQPGKRMPSSAFGNPRSDQSDVILVESSPMVRAQVTLVYQAEHAVVRITPGGLLGNRLINTFGIARKIKQVLRGTPGIGAS